MVAARPCISGVDTAAAHRARLGRTRAAARTPSSPCSYAADESGKTEQWKAVDFDAVNRAKTSIGAARP
jgi:hypothetical protein